MLRSTGGVGSAWRGAGVACLLVGALLLTGTACVALDPTVDSEHVPATSTAEAEPTEVPADTPTPEPTPEPTPYDGELAMMRIPSLGVEAPIEAIGRIPGVNKLAVPLPRNVGWYHIFDKPGFGTSSLYSAHKDWYPNIRGPFYALTELQEGDLVIVVMDDGREYVYEVFFQRRYEAGGVPMTDLIDPHEAEDPELLRPAGEEWLTLITCGGDFVAEEEEGPGYYVHRDVVIAKLVETKPGPSVRTLEGGD